ncbi:unnamed protein product [Ambrosiozyma monospora]|uniref:Unnamed protein product n=1 Tax=Ambrosiozyma monospora TaxID=43982 RepID=A0A9W6YTV7_AMBMO|nr:unnamed protein product [Ambrosiozyma monospora]
MQPTTFPELSNTRDFRSESKFSLKCFCDATFASVPVERKSQSGYAFFTNGPIQWKTAKQSLTAQSSCEAEYVCLAEASNEGEVLLRLFSFIAQFLPDGSLNSNSIDYYEDNSSSILVAQSEQLTKRTRYVDIKWHVVKDRVKAMKMLLHKIEGENQVADVLTKPAARPVFVKLMPYLVGGKSFQELLNLSSSNSS